MAQPNSHDANPSASGSQWTDVERQVISVLAELYSGFVVECDVAKQLDNLDIPVERLEEILRYTVHPALYTRLAWNGTGYESQSALAPADVEARIAASNPAKMNMVSKFASDKFWTYGMESTWTAVKQQMSRSRS